MDYKDINFRSTSDGWRAIIAESFTFENIRKTIIAIGEYLLATCETNPIRVLIGYDTRFMGNVFAQITADTLSSRGIIPFIIHYPVPTPLVSWYTYEEKFNIGLMITASHNPPYYSGIKIRMPSGGPPDKETMETIESLICGTIPPMSKTSFQSKSVDPRQSYIEAIRQLIDLSAIDRYAPIVAVDSMHGSTAGLLRDILAGTNSKIIQIRGNPDPLFGGISPEPKLSTIAPLWKKMRQKKCCLGVSHDGDGDRIIAVDPEYGYMSPHNLIVVLAYDLVQRRKLPGIIVSSVSTTRQVQITASILGREFLEVPIGFRNSAQIMREKTVLLAGEENGGIGIGLHMPERDGTLIAALLIELMATRDCGIGEFYSEIEKKIGKSVFLRKDIKIDSVPSELMDKLSQKLPKTICGNSIKNISKLDGIKVYFENNAWVLIRAAGTEPLIRIYAEAETSHICESIINEIVILLNNEGN